MKIAFIGQKGIPAKTGGVERHVEHIATRLAKDKRNEVFVYYRKNYFTTPRNKFKGVTLVSIPTIATKHLDAIVYTFFATIDAMRKDFDVIHYHAIGPALLSWMPKIFKRNTKVVFTFHCRDYFHKKWGFIARTSLKVGEWTGCMFADHIIVVSKGLQQYVKNKYGKNAIYIPNGSETPTKAKADNITKKWGLKRNSYIVTISRLVAHKGIHYLIEAYKNLNTDKKLVIVGDSAYTDEYVDYLKDLARDNPNIIFTGRQSGKTLHELYTNAHVFVQPSEQEGLSIALLEAFGYGNVVLASDIAENREVVENVGFMFKTKNVRDLTKQLRIVLRKKNAIKDASKAGPSHIKRNYNWDTITKQISEVYSEPEAHFELKKVTV